MLEQRSEDVCQSAASRLPAEFLQRNSRAPQLRRVDVASNEHQQIRGRLLQSLSQILKQNRLAFDVVMRDVFR